jgi:hypothetical protein
MKRLFDKLRDALDRYEAAGLELSEFTALLALKPEPTGGREQLLQRLRALDSVEHSPLLAASGVHQARFIVLERAKLASSEAAPDFPFGPLVFSLVHDGDTEDVLHELFERCAETLDGLLEHCADYPGSKDRDACVRQLMAAGVQSGYAYYDSHAPRREVLRALELRRRFVDFVIHQQRATDHELSRAFDRFRAGRWPDQPSQAKPKSASVRARARASVRPTFSAPANDTLGARLDYGVPLMRPFERPIPDEQYWVRRLAELATARSRRNQRNPTATVSRAGEALLLRATFSVRADLPAEFQHGVFVPGGRYAAWLRVSTGSSAAHAGGANDPPDLAIKLERVGSLGHVVDAGLPESSAAACQDFVLSSQPTFFSRDVRDLTVLRSILDTRDESARARRMAVFALRRPRESWILARRLSQRNVRPLETDYHSVTAFALGPQLAIKYRLGPAPQLPAAAAARPAGETLQLRLDPSHGEAVALEFFAVVPSRDMLPVEDPRIDWESAGGNRVLLARIDVDPQDLASQERTRLAESLTFTPWHTLDAHRPLGGFNRARLELDRASAEARAAVSGRLTGELHAPLRERAPGEPRAPLADQASAERRTRPPSVRASAGRLSVPQLRSRSSAPPADRLRAPKSIRAPSSRRKRNRSVH